MNGKRGIANYFSKRDDLSSIKKAKLTEIDVDNRDRENESFEQSSKCIKIVSWNVAGLHAAVKKDFCSTVKKLNPDIMCIQETKTSLKKQPPSEISEKLKLWKYRYYFDSVTKNGYSGELFKCLKCIERSLKYL